MKDIKEVIHLYKRPQVKILVPGYDNIVAPAILDHIKEDADNMPYRVEFGTKTIRSQTHKFAEHEIKLIVRRLSSMTDEEKTECDRRGSMAWNNAQDHMEIFSQRLFDRHAAETAYRLSIGIWLFGNEAFDEGLIIDKDTHSK